jgi:hypothetical protein
VENLLTFPHADNFAFHFRKVDSVGHLAIHALEHLPNFVKR